MNEKNINIRNFFILLGSTLSVMAGAAVTPALPGITQAFAGQESIEFMSKLILSLPPLFIALFSFVAGYFFEKYGRKKVLIASAILYGLAGTSGFFLNDIYIILLGRAVLGISIAGLMTGFIVVVGDIFVGDKMKKFIGVQGAVMSMGGVVYLILGGKLADLGWNYPFLIYSIAFVVAAGIYFFLTETSTAEKSQKIEKVKFSKELITINITSIFVMIFYLMVPTQLPFLMKANFPDFSASSIGIFISIWILFSSLASIFYSKIGRHFRFNTIYSMGFALWAVSYVLILFSGNLTMLVAALCLSGVANGIVVPNLKTHLLAEASPRQRGRQSGFLTMSLYLGQFLSPILVQPFLGVWSIGNVFVLFALPLGLLAVFFLLKKSPII